MAQATGSKDVRKNCVDVEHIITEGLTKPEKEKIQELAEPNQSSELSKKLLKFNSKYNSKYNAKYHQELIPIERVKYKLTYRNYAVY